MPPTPRPAISPVTFTPRLSSTTMTAIANTAKVTRMRMMLIALPMASPV